MLHVPVMPICFGVPHRNHPTANTTPFSLLAAPCSSLQLLLGAVSVMALISPGTIFRFVALVVLIRPIVDTSTTLAPHRQQF